MNYLLVLPMAFVMVAGPQIFSAIFLATSEDYRRNSAAFVSGVFLSISLIVTIAYYLGIGAIGQRSSNQLLYGAILILLLLEMIHVYLKREQSHPPKVDENASDRKSSFLVQTRLSATGILSDR